MIKNILIVLVITLVLIGCEAEVATTETVVEPVATTEPVVEPVAPVACEETLYGHLTEAWLERVTYDNIVMTHYINDEYYEDNVADVVDFNGAVATSNMITVPEYVGQPMKHRLVIEFYQVN